MKNLDYEFYTNGDTGVIDIAYKAGENFVKKLRGMFSICMYEINNKKIFLLETDLELNHFTFIVILYFLSSEIKDILFLKIFSVKMINSN